MLDTINGYLDLGWSVFPVNPKNKKPFIKWSKYQTTRATRDDVKTWIRKFPSCGWGVATGKLSNLAVIDFETRAAIDYFEANVCDLPETIISITGRKSGEGRHYFFSYPDNFNIRNSVKKFKDTDFRGEGGFIVLPPSSHVSGRKYAWDKINPIDYGLDDLCDMPDEAVRFFNEDDRKQKNKEGWLSELLLGVSEGSRNDAAAKYAGWLLNNNGGNQIAAWDALLGWNQRNQPPLKEPELRKVLESISSLEGTNSFRQKTKIGISRLEILRYPDNTREYKLYVNDVEGTVSLTPADLCSPAKFEIKLLTITDRLYELPRKLIEWRNLINPLLEEAVRIDIPEEETDIQTLEEIISLDLSQGGDEPEKAGKLVNMKCLRVDGVIYIKMKALLKKIEHTHLRRMDRKGLAQLLRVSGFEYSEKSVRVGEVCGKVWLRK